MYYEYFGIQQPPFKITPDTNMFFPGANRGAVLQSLAYAIANGEGIVKVVGEVGSGKTMLCRMLEVGLPENVEIIYLANPSITPDSLLHAIAFELGLGAEDNQLRANQMLQEYLVNKHAENRSVVVFVEEAQNMPLETLEQLRLLSNLETQQEKLLQIVLFGQPELDHNLAKQSIRQLKERITYSFSLAPLKTYEVRDYINTRLRVGGYKGMDLFDRKAYQLIAKYSQGLLRRINILADKACLAAYADNAKSVTGRHVRTAIRDSGFGSRTAPSPWWFAAGASVLGVALISAAIWHRYGNADKAAAGVVTERPSPGAAIEAAPEPAKPAAEAPAAPVAGTDMKTAAVAQIGRETLKFDLRRMINTDFLSSMDSEN